jgi:hypothetical protein
MSSEDMALDPHIDPIEPDGYALPDAPNQLSQSKPTVTALLCALRALAGPCAPPIGSGAFDILYANEREIVVWYVPTRDGWEQREVTIPAPLASAAWELILRGAPVNEALLRTLAPGAAGARWLFALLAQIPGVETLRDLKGPDDAPIVSGERQPALLGDDEERISLIWRG